MSAQTVKNEIYLLRCQHLSHWLCTQKQKLSSVSGGFISLLALSRWDTYCLCNDGKFCSMWSKGIKKKILPLTQLTDQIQLLQYKLKWKQLLIFEGFLPRHQQIWTESKQRHLRSINHQFNSERTSWVPTHSARDTTRRRSFVLGPFRAFSASTRDDSTSSRCSLYFLSEITLFCTEWGTSN